MDYLVVNANYHLLGMEADVVFATNELSEAKEAARDHGPGTVVVRQKRDMTEKVIFTAPWDCELPLAE